MSAASLPSFIQSPHLLVHSDVVHGFTTRNGGVGEPPFDTLNLGLHVGDHPNTVISNRRLACESLGFTLRDWVSGEQVHGVNIALVGKSDAGRGSTHIGTSLTGTDGLITSTPGLLLAAYFADCVPLFFVDPVVPAIGIAHAGWRGTLGGIAERMVEQFQASFDTPPQRLQVWLGPSIGPCCYQVDQSMAEQFRNLALASSYSVIEQRDATFYLDLRLVNRLRLLAAGLYEQNINVSNHCTSCDTKLFFSHRKHGPTTGRMAGLIGIIPFPNRQDSVRLK